MWPNKDGPTIGAFLFWLDIRFVFPAGSLGFHSPYGSDGDDGDGQGSRFWGVMYVPQGEAPFSAPQAKKILA